MDQYHASPLLRRTRVNSLTGLETSQKEQPCRIIRPSCNTRSVEDEICRCLRREKAITPPEACAEIQARMQTRLLSSWRAELVHRLLLSSLR